MARYALLLVFVESSLHMKTVIQLFSFHVDCFLAMQVSTNFMILIIKAVTYQNSMHVIFES